jgi:glycosyl transferase family 25
MKVYVINLESARERRAKMEARLEALGLEHSFHPAIDGRKMTEDQRGRAYDEAATRRNLGRGLEAGEIGCAQSHREVYARIATEGLDRACILEDDAVLDEGLPAILAWLDSADIRGQVVKLDNYLRRTTPCSLWQDRAIDGRHRLRKPVTMQWMAWGYVIHREAAEAILRRWPRVEFCADDWGRMSSVVALRCVQPAVVDIDEGQGSIIGDGRYEAIPTDQREARPGVGVKRLAYVAKTTLRMLLP